MDTDTAPPEPQDDKPPTGTADLSCSSLLAPRTLGVPQKAQCPWRVGQIGVKHITFRPDDCPLPSCILGVVVEVKEGGDCKLFALDSYSYTVCRPKSISETLTDFERFTDEITVKYYRDNITKFEEMASFLTPDEWMSCMTYWRDHEEDRPDEYDLLRKNLLG